MARRQVLFVFLSFIVGVLFANFIPRLITSILPDHWHEVARVTSPDGAVDAVVENAESCAFCPAEYLVSVVQKGAKVPNNATSSVFMADEVGGPEIRWKQSHLLEIAYGKALIDSFRNVAYPLGKFGSEGSWRYAVEIRLAPSSSGFSYLKDGAKSTDSQ